jgi:hypothetical protein
VAASISSLASAWTRAGPVSVSASAAKPISKGRKLKWALTICGPVGGVGP